MHTEVVGLYMLHPLLPGMQATHGIQQGGCSVTEAAKLQANCQTGCRLPLPSHFFLFSLLKMFLLLLNFVFRLTLLCLKSLLLIPWLLLSWWSCSLTIVALGQMPSQDSFRYSIHTAVYIHVPILSVVAIQAI